jgi:hypothetical protein
MCSRSASVRVASLTHREERLPSFDDIRGELRPVARVHPRVVLAGLDLLQSLRDLQ